MLESSLQLDERSLRVSLKCEPDFEGQRAAGEERRDRTGITRSMGKCRKGLFASLTRTAARLLFSAAISGFPAPLAKGGIRT
jgi:hypothetical protein